MVKLYDARGRLVQPRELQTEIAAPSIASIRSIWRDPEADRLTPERLGTILRAAVTGDADAYLTLAEEMEERDWHYSSVLRTRKLAVSGLPIAVQAASESAEDRQIADDVRALTEEPEFVELLADLLDGLGKGYSVVELVWQRSVGNWWPTWRWRDPRFFCVDRDTGMERLRLREIGAPDGVPLAPYKFITHVPRLKSGIPLRGGLARLVAAAYMCKSYSLKDWLAFAEVFGLPIRVGRYGSAATERDIQRLISAVANIGTDAAAVVHESMKIELQAAPSGQGGPDLFRGLADWLDSQVSKAILGQTMTADNGSSYAQAAVHNDVRADLCKADARQLSGTLNRDLVRAYVDLNYGPRDAYPRVAIYLEEHEDLKALAVSLPPFIDRGLKVSARALLDRFGLVEPKDGEAVLQPTTSVAAAAAAGAATMRARMQRADARPITDEIADEMLKDWRRVMDPIVSPLERAIMSARSFDELEAALEDAAGSMDSTRLVHELAVALFKAHGLGDASDHP